MYYVIILISSIKCHAKNLGIYSFTKNEVIHRCSSRILIAPSAGSFTDSHFQVGSFLTIFCGTKTTLEWTTSPIMPCPHPLFIEIFSRPPSIIQYFEDSIPPFVNRGFKLWYIIFLQR